MRKRIVGKVFFAAIAMVLMMSAAAAAGTVTIYYNGHPYQAATEYGGGGEFYVAGLSYLNGGYHGSARDDYYKKNGPAGSTTGGGIPTFCLERNEYIVNGGKYSYTISHYAQAGGLGGATGGKDAISQGTVYLYSEFANGTLEGYDYGTTGRRASAGELQKAIWFLEDELNGTSYALTSSKDNYTKNIFLLALKSKYEKEAGKSLGWAEVIAKAKADAVNTHGVGVLNLYDNTGAKQDQLLMVPEPASILLLGAGLFGLAVVRRKSRRI